MTRPRTPATSTVIQDSSASAVGRRAFLRLLAAGMALPAAGGLLAACGGAAPTPTPLAPVAPTAAGARPTAQATTPATAAGGAGATAASTAAPTAGTSATGATLVVGGGLGFKSLDPGRLFEVESNMIGHATYDSLVTFEGEDLKTPKPSLASKWEIASDGKAYTFTLQPNAKFAGGSAVTSTDVKWSLERLKNLKGNPAFLVDAVDEIQAPAPQTVMIKLKAATPAILPILSSPSLGILDSKLVTENGGDASAEAKDKDKAEAYLNGKSAGSGPFMLSSYTPNQEVVLVKNPNYWRGAPKIDRVVIRAILEPATQKLQVEKGDLDIAMSLGQDQIKDMKNSPGVTAKTSPDATTIYVLMNNNPEVGGPFTNPKVQQAVRYALDYDGIMALAGTGAVRLAGIIPTNFPGALDPATAVKMDQAKAKSLLKEANLGDVKGALSYRSDSTLFGIQTPLLAQKIQEDLAAVGIQVTLDGQPLSTALQKYRDGKDQIGVWGWATDYADEADFLVYLPGRTVGKRAGWAADATPEAQDLVKLGQQAEVEIDDAKRVALYKQVDQRIAEIGPYAPLFQPAIPYAFRSNVQGVTYNTVWAVDLYPISKTG